MGRFPIQKDLIATKAPAGTTLPATQTSCFNYSPDGRIEAVVLPEGNGVEYGYRYNLNGTTVTMTRGFGVDTSGAWAANCRGRTAPAHDPGEGPASGRVYKPGGFLFGEVDENQASRKFDTDGFGRVIQITSPPNGVHAEDPVGVQQFGYDSAGHRIWEAVRAPGTAYGRPTLPDPSVLSYSESDYDLSGRVIQQRAYVLDTGEVLTKKLEFDDNAGTLKVTDRGAVTYFTYDGRGRVVTTSLPDTSVTRVVHGLGVDTATIQSNSKGNVVRVFNYDTRGELLNVTTSTGTLLYQATYDDDGNQLTETRAGEGPLTWTYDAFDRLVSETKTINSTTTAASIYQYDRNDRVNAHFDAENSGGVAGGKGWTMTFTGTDAPLSVTDPLSRTGNYVYSQDPKWSHSLLATMTEPNGRVSSFRYDSQARLIDVFNGACLTTGLPWDCGVPLASQRHLTYDARSNVVQVDAPSRPSVVMTYDSLGRVVDDMVGVESRVHHAFLDQGRTQQTQISYGSALATMTHRYDTSGRLHTVELGGQTSPLATYDFGVGVGGPLSLAYSNGATATYSYDDKLRQTGIDVTFKVPGMSTTTPVTSLHEAFGADSIPRLRQHKIGTKAAMTDVFEVDQDGRVTNENLLVPGILTLPAGEIGNADVNSYIQQGANWSRYDLDKIGNIKVKTTKTSTLVHTVDKLSRLTKLNNVAVALDSTDNLSGKQGDPVQFKYDGFTGVVISASVGSATTTFTYDALDRRRGEHRPNGSDHVYVWDGSQLVGHGLAGGSPTLDVPGDDIDAHIASIDQFGAGSQWFYHQGRDQSVLAVTGSAGLVEAYTYSAFGDLTIWNGAGNRQTQSAFGNIFQFQGQVFDASTATYSMRAREYHPSWGQFLSPDPISLAGGPSLFSFTGSRPLQSRDPLGLLADSWNKPRLWMTEWMGTWSQDPGAAGQQFLFAPESQVQYDLQQQVLGQLNAYAATGTSYSLRSGEVHKTVDGIENVRTTNFGTGTSESSSTSFHIDLAVGTMTSVGGRLYPTDRVFAGPVGWVVHLLEDGTMRLGRKLFSKAEATAARRAEENVLIRGTEQAAHEVEVAANGGKKVFKTPTGVRKEAVLKHKGHDLPNDNKGLPHFQTLGRLGHTFWGAVVLIFTPVWVDIAGVLDAGREAGNSSTEHPPGSGFGATSQW